MNNIQFELSITKIKTEDEKPYIKNIIKLKGFRTTLIEYNNGNRYICRFYRTIGKLNF